VIACSNKRYESGRGQPQSTTWRTLAVPPNTRQRLGLRLSSAAFRRISNFCNDLERATLTSEAVSALESRWAANPKDEPSLIRLLE